MATDDPQNPKLRAGDTAVFTDTLTDTTTGEPIDADLTDGWEAQCQVRQDYALDSPLICEFESEITGPNTIKQTLFEDQSLLLDTVPFEAEATATRTVYWDAQVRKPDGLGAGKDYVKTYLSGTITILGQVTRDAS